MQEPYHPAALLRLLLRICFGESVGQRQKQRFRCEGDLRVAAAARRTVGPGRAGTRGEEAASPSPGSAAGLRGGAKGALQGEGGIGVPATRKETLLQSRPCVNLIGCCFQAEIRHDLSVSVLKSVRHASVR